jgi:thiosulfate dehydrogenase
MIDFQKTKDFARAALLACAFITFHARAEQTWPLPDPAALADGAHKEQILYGEKLIRETYSVVGPEVADPSMRYAGNNLACTSCHLDGGRRRLGLSFIGVREAYPANMARENEVRTLTQRINGCMERSMNGRPLRDDSDEIAAMIAYIGFLSDAKPDGVDGRGMPPLDYLDRAADTARGGRVYADNCAVCHGEDGQGVRRGDVGDAQGYLYPPLWGDDSFNTGAGMHRLIKSARFIRANMPFGVTHDAPLLSVDDAWDVAAYINAQPRPEKAGLDRDFPDRSRKPVDAPFPPFDDAFPLEQHILGPYQPMIDAQKKPDGR